MKELKILEGRLEADFSSPLPGPNKPFVWAMEVAIPAGAAPKCYRFDGIEEIEVPSLVTPIGNERCLLVVVVSHFSRYAWA